MRIQNSFLVFILPVYLATIYSLLLIRVRGESCGALTIAEPGDDATTLRDKAFANFRQNCRKKQSQLSTASNPVMTCAIIDVDITQYTGSSGCSNSVLDRGTECTLTWIDHSGQPADAWVLYEHVGLEDSSIIPDGRFIASSVEGVRYARNGRLNFNYPWCAATSDPDPWIEVDLVTAQLVSGVITQGSTYNPSTQASRVSEYQVSYQTVSGVHEYVEDTSGAIEIFSGNKEDGATPVIQLFKETIQATRVRLEALKRLSDLNCMRFELLGCRLSNI